MASSAKLESAAMVMSAAFPPRNALRSSVKPDAAESIEAVPWLITPAGNVNLERISCMTPMLKTRRDSGSFETPARAANPGRGVPSGITAIS